MYEMQRRHSTTTLTPLYEKAERDWSADPINNPTEFPNTSNPFTVEVVERFYQRCDATCDNSSLNDSTPKCVRFTFQVLTPVLTEPDSGCFVLFLLRVMVLNLS